jgi:signal transduction histidine kinase
VRGRLVADLLSLARIEGRGPQAELIDLAEVARETATEVGGVEVTAEPASVRGDADGLARALRNLLDNATTAAEPDGRVRLVVRAANGSAVATVLDDGPGIPPAECERIFERFVRLAPKGRPGSGLGLSIAREIARQHGGDLVCDPVERGASFTLRLPRVVA